MNDATAYLSLGSNLGDREGHLKRALDALQSRNTRVARISSLYETEPVGFAAQPWFLNLAVKIAARIPPRPLLDFCLGIERSLGRARTFRCAPRTIDLDILLYGNEIVEEPSLTIPHPRMAERRFVLLPLAEIAPEALHPALRRTVLSLLDSCPDSAVVRRYAPGGSC